MDVVKMYWSKESVRAALKTVAVTLCLSVIYYLSVQFTLNLSVTGGGIGIRVGNSLRALSLVSPLIPVALGLGSYMVNISLGRLFIGLYWLIPILHFALGWGVYKVAKKEPCIRNFLLLVLYGCFMALIVTVNHALIRFPAALTSEFYDFFIKAIQVRLIGEVLATAIVGYPLYLSFQSYKLWKKGR